MKTKRHELGRWVNLPALAALIQDVDAAPDIPDQRKLDPEVFGWDYYTKHLQQPLQKAA